MPKHGGLIAHIDTDAETCTSVLVDGHLKGRFRTWAIAAAYGDNLRALPGAHFVWLVDDDASIRWVLEKALHKADIETRSFPDAGKIIESGISVKQRTLRGRPQERLVLVLAMDVHQAATGFAQLRERVGKFCVCRFCLGHRLKTPPRIIP